MVKGLHGEPGSRVSEPRFKYVARARADFSILEARRAKVLICGPCARGLFEISLTVRDADAASAREDFSYGSDSGI